MKAWHFTGDTLRDGSPLPRKGRWLTYSGEVRMCKSGLHASLEPFDALQYAPGARLHLVEVSDVADQQDDKVVARKRKIIASIDATELLRYFARMQALSCVDALQSTPPDVVLDYLMTGDEAVRSAAWSAAWSAARSAESAESAARSARSAAESAAESAAWSAAWSARSAESAAWSAESAAWSAAWGAARAEFNALVYEIFAEYL